MELTYADYLRVEDLLTLQRVRSEPEEHDELLFFVVHQAYELWFKLLHELDKVKVVTLCTSKGFPQLEELHLTANTITDSGADALIAAPFAPQIRRLHLYPHNVSESGRRRLIKRFGSALASVALWLGALNLLCGRVVW